MASKWICVAFLATTVAALAACSKSEDTAPDRKVFGDPPRIESATLDQNEESVSCDWQLPLDCLAFVAPDSFGFPNVTPLDFTDDCLSPCQRSEADQFLCTEHELYLRPQFCNFVTLFPDHLITQGNYTQLQFKVKVTDPNSTTPGSDILLVSASFVTDPNATTNKEETSLVLFDDGSAGEFPYTQPAAPVGLEDCTPTSTDGVLSDCRCQQGRYTLRSGDTLAKDGIYERDFALFNVREQNGRTLIGDCIAREKHQAPFSSTVSGVTLEFRIDAVDKAGNVATWPTKPTAVVHQNTYSCTGDDCMCCILATGVPRACQGRPGLIGTLTPEGVCNSPLAN